MEKKQPGKVLCTYFNGGPVSYDLIDRNLYLGNLSGACDLNTLRKHKITHIVTIEKNPLPEHIQNCDEIKTLFIDLLDLPTENLLRYFDETYDFISEGVRTGVVYVHCYFGVSRSASVVLAYMMRKNQLSYYEAYELVKKKRVHICPNQGFVKQLQVYCKMKYRVNPDDMNYRVLLLSMASDKVKRTEVLPDNCKELIRNESEEGPGFRCKKCRKWLARNYNRIAHCDTENSVCGKKYFFEPLRWMADVDKVVQGKLHCPKCRGKVGGFDWAYGHKCDCGCQVSPAFYLLPSKVDRS